MGLEAEKPQQQGPEKKQSPEPENQPDTSDVDGTKDQAETDLESCTKKEARRLLGKHDDEQDRQNVTNYINTRIEGIERVEDLRTLSLEQLFDLEEKYEGILFYAFTDFMDGRAKLDFPRWEEAYKNPKSGDKFVVNFLGNQEAYDKLGAGDILPPSVRQITVLEDGDEERKRVSERRIGLKGRVGDNRSGFFDEEGYMPIFTGDVIIIGEPDNEFNKYRKQDGKLDYTAYEQSELGQKEAKDAETFFANRRIQTTKQPTPEDIDELMRGIEAEGNGQKVVNAVNAALKEGMRGDHCWDWVNKVYKKAGVSSRRIYQDLNYSGKKCGDHHASDELMGKLRAGDWVYINNQNRYDENGCHSAIFLGWINEDRQIAKMASCPGSGKKGRITRENLKKQPITYIAKPL